jgi:nicotinamide-nucleotide amidase
MPLKACIITIGDELLIGQTIDTNSAWISQQLGGIGVAVCRRIAIGDDEVAIVQTLNDEWAAHDIIIVTGGLGPTDDDLTKPVLTKYFKASLKRDPETEEHIRKIFEKRGRALLERNLKQADVPDNCTVLRNELGTAPGMWFEKDEKIIISLPGVPFEMIAIMEKEALPKLRQRTTLHYIVHRGILTAGVPESQIAELIEGKARLLPPHIKLAYLPDAGMVRLRLSGEGNDERSLIKEIEQRREELALLLDDAVISMEDLTLEHILGKLFTGKGLKLALAESCTGGYLAHKLTQIIGSAQYFMGSIVCYQPEVKEHLLNVPSKLIEKHGIVSEEVALEMAKGARKQLRSDIGFGVTGLLSGSDEDEVKVGTVCLAACDENRSATKTMHFRLDRLRNKELAATHSLLFIWKFVQGKV